LSSIAFVRFYYRAFSVTQRFPLVAGYDTGATTASSQQWDDPQTQRRWGISRPQAKTTGSEGRLDQDHSSWVLSQGHLP
jgi:hypothetical protein